MRVLVTGGTGYLGGAIVRALAAHGHDPVVFARHAASADLPADTIAGDVRDRAAIRAAAQGTDAIVHAAALVSAWQPRPLAFDEVNAGGLENVLAAARELAIPRVVYTSSFLARPPAGRDAPLDANDYQRSKRRARAIALGAIDAGMPLVALVPGVVYGPGRMTEGNLVGRMVGDHLAGRLPGLIGADRCWSCAYVADVAEAHVAALAPHVAPGEYLLGGENVPQVRVFEIVRNVTGVPLPRRVPRVLDAVAAWTEETAARLAGRPPRITRGIVEILHHDWPMDSARSVEELGYCITPLDRGMRALLSGV